MSLRINLQHASWLAHVFSPGGPVPDLDDSRDGAKRDVLRQFLYQLDRGFYPEAGHEQRCHEEITALADVVDPFGRDRNEFSERLNRVRSMLGSRPWTAFIVPSSINRELDETLCEPALLREVVRIRPSKGGLIFQLQEPITDTLALSNLFPAFTTALSSINEWPGVLVWLESGESMFFPISELPIFYKQLHWIFSQLATTQMIDLQQLSVCYLKEFGKVSASKDNVAVIHLSDLHIGSSEANKKLPRLKQLVLNIVSDYKETGGVVVAISGDLMDSPTEHCLNEVRLFLDDLAVLTEEYPIICLGNRDVREGSDLWSMPNIASRLPNLADNIRFFFDSRLGIVSFNSVGQGNLCRGFVGEQQMADVGTRLAREMQSHEARLIGMIHHHPKPVEVPSWYARPFYGNFLDAPFGKTESMHDAEEFISFVEAQNFDCILHGHKHIPHVGKSNAGMPIYGCGSSVGKKGSIDGDSCISINVISCNLSNNRLSARLLAEGEADGSVESHRAELISISRG